MPARQESVGEDALGNEFARRYIEIRKQSLKLCLPLVVEDFGVQPMADASPPKWHLAHTTWFFETFILKERLVGYRVFNEHFEYLFNSYYNGIGTPFPRAKRGFLSRPTVEEIFTYRAHVDQHMLELLEQKLNNADADRLKEHLTLGLNHEQQHQELLLTDIKYNFGNNPLQPIYGGGPVARESPRPEASFDTYVGGVVEIGADTGFAFDNERPQHQVLLQDFALARHLVCNGEYLNFVEDGGYARADLWLAEGWAISKAQGWQAPLYWQHKAGRWFEYRLDGRFELDQSLPVVHVSAHEAFAFAAWSNARLPTEFEWENVARQQSTVGSFVDAATFHPSACSGDASTPTQLFGEVWQWTSSSYGPYPGYRPLPGTLGEYNGKFMSSQLVLRGGSCATPSDHIRASYRNFFYPPDRWQFSGIRLAKDV